MTNPIRARPLPISRGARWFHQGFRLFRNNPANWIGAVLIYLVIYVLASLIPVVGNLLMLVLEPVFLGGMMLGCAHQWQGGRFTIGHLFQGFSLPGRQLFNLGLIYAGLSLLCLLPALLLGAGALLAPEAGTPADLLPALLGVLLSLALYLPLLMAYWLAPALIVDNRLGALEAMRLSLSGSLKNILPALIYGLVVLLWIVLGALPLGAGLLVVIPSLFASVYAAYQDIFITDNNLV